MIKGDFNLLIIPSNSGLLLFPCLFVFCVLDCFVHSMYVFCMWDVEYGMLSLVLIFESL